MAQSNNVQKMKKNNAHNEYRKVDSKRTRNKHR